MTNTPTPMTEIDKIEDWFYRHATKEPDGTYTLVLHENHDWVKAKEDLLSFIRSYKKHE